MHVVALDQIDTTTQREVIMSQREGDGLLFTCLEGDTLEASELL